MITVLNICVKVNGYRLNFKTESHGLFPKITAALFTAGYKSKLNYSFF